MRKTGGTSNNKRLPFGERNKPKQISFGSTTWYLIPHFVVAAVDWCNLTFCLPWAVPMSLIPHFVTFTVIQITPVYS